MSASSKSSWVSLPSSTQHGPKAVYHHSCIFTSKQTMMIFGGETPGASSPQLSDSFFLYKSRSWHPTKRNNSPPPTCLHGCVAWQAKMVVFGGRTAQGLSNEMFVYNEETTNWSRARQNGEIPSPREAHSLSILPIRIPDASPNVETFSQALIVFGGHSGSNAESDENSVFIMPLDAVDLRWRRVQLENAPPHRSYHTTATIGSKLFIFGGRTLSGQILNDLWMIDFSSEQPVCVQITQPDANNDQKASGKSKWPAGRYGHAITPIPSTASIYMCGGTNQDNQSPDNSLWIFSTISMTWEEIEDQGVSRSGHTLVAIGPSKLCMIGGIDLAHPSNYNFEAFVKNLTTDQTTKEEIVNQKSSPNAPPIPVSSTSNHAQSDGVTQQRLLKKGKKKAKAADAETETPNQPEANVSHVLEQSQTKTTSEHIQADSNEISSQTKQGEINSDKSLASLVEDSKSKNGSDTDPEPANSEHQGKAPGLTNEISSSHSSSAAPIENLAVANIKISSKKQRQRSTRISIAPVLNSSNNNSLSYSPLIPTDSDIIDNMEPSVLRNDLKTFSKFVNSLKRMMEDSSTNAESHLAELKSFVTSNLPRLTYPEHHELSHSSDKETTSVPSVTSPSLESPERVESAVQPSSPNQHLAPSHSTGTQSSNSPQPQKSTSGMRASGSWGSIPSALASVSPVSSPVASHSPVIGHRRSGNFSLSPSNSSTSLNVSGDIPVNIRSEQPSEPSLQASKSNPRVIKDFETSSTAEKQIQVMEAQMEASLPTTGAVDNEATRKERQYVVKELLETEKNYVRDLKLIVEEFLEPLSSILNPKQIMEIFSTIKALVPLHEQLLDKLSETIEKPDAEQVPGQIFLAMADYLKMYTGFCASQSGVAQKISDISKQNSTFRKFLEQKMKDPKCRGLSLTAFLVMPIQRVCRFPLLLKQIFKSTPVTHLDFKHLHFAIAKVDKVVLAVNEGKRAIEAQIQMLELDQTLTWEKKAPANFVFIDPTRRFILQEPVEMLNGSKIEPILFMLFNDILLFCRTKESGGVQMKRIKKAFALLETHMSLDEETEKEKANGKALLHLVFGEDSINILFPTKEKRSEIQITMQETISKLVPSLAGQEVVSSLQSYYD